MTDKKPFYICMGATVLYLSFFFPSFYICLLIPGLFENSEITGRAGSLLTLLSAMPALSIMISLGYAWGYYFKERTKAMYISLLVPVVVTGTILLIFCFYSLTAKS